MKTCPEPCDLSYIVCPESFYHSTAQHSHVFHLISCLSLLEGRGRCFSCALIILCWMLIKGPSSVFWFLLFFYWLSFHTCSFIPFFHSSCHPSCRMISPSPQWQVPVGGTGSHSSPARLCLQSQVGVGAMCSMGTVGAFWGCHSCRAAGAFPMSGLELAATSPWLPLGFTQLPRDLWAETLPKIVR